MTFSFTYLVLKTINIIPIDNRSTYAYVYNDINFLYSNFRVK